MEEAVVILVAVLLRRLPSWACFLTTEEAVVIPLDVFYLVIWSLSWQFSLLFCGLKSVIVLLAVLLPVFLLAVLLPVFLLAVLLPVFLLAVLLPVFLLAVLLAGDYRRLISCLAVEAVTAPFGVSLSRGCYRLIYCCCLEAAIVPLSILLCEGVIVLFTVLSCDWLCFSLHVLSYEVLLGALNNIKRVSHSLFIGQISNSSDVLER